MVPSADSSAAWSGQSGCCAAGRSRHETGVHVSSTPHRLPANRRSRRSDVDQPGRQGPAQQLGELVAGVPELAQHLVRVLAERGRGGARRQVLAVDRDRRAERPHRAGRGVRVLDDRPRRVGGHLGHRARSGRPARARGRTRRSTRPRCAPRTAPAGAAPARPALGHAAGVRRVARRRRPAPAAPACGAEATRNCTSLPTARLTNPSRRRERSRTARSTGARCRTAPAPSPATSTSVAAVARARRAGSRTATPARRRPRRSRSASSSAARCRWPRTCRVVMSAIATPTFIGSPSASPVIDMIAGLALDGEVEAGPVRVRALRPGSRRSSSRRPPGRVADERLAVEAELAGAARAGSSRRRRRPRPPAAADDREPARVGEVDRDRALAAVRRQVVRRLALDERRAPGARLDRRCPGRSTLTTSAPRSASIIVQYGPASTRERSSTRTPASGAAALMPRAPRG